MYLETMLLNDCEERPVCGDQREVSISGAGNGPADRPPDVLPPLAERPDSLEPLSAGLPAHHSPPLRHAERHPRHEEVASS
jgi:hypothetical protein